MATQTYNANPTLFAPSAQSFRKNNVDTLWLKHGDTDSEEDDDESPIDAQEVFGGNKYHVMSAKTLNA